MPESSPAEGPPTRASSSSRVHQKRQKACDACHRRKIRCNGEEGGPNPCSYCVKNGYECTYNHRPNKWPPSKTYVDGLEVRVGELERRVDFLKRELAKARNMPSAPDVETSDDDTSEGWSVKKREEDKDSDTEAALRALTDGYEDLWLGNPTGMRISQEPRMFHGRTSHFQVVNQHLAEVGSKTINKGKFFQLRIRPEFRMVDPDIFDPVDLHHAPPEWPEDDLAATLINAFFDKWNNVMPLLHKPTFMRQYADPTMRMDSTWVSVAFGVFAIASKFVDDPRALGIPDTAGHYFEAGIKYWREMKRVGSPLYAPPSLFRLQSLILFTYFLSGGPLFPSAGWALIGLGLRYVQDAGMHLKNEWLKRAKAHPFEYEMRKRVFWVLYMIERTMALEMDRSFCMPEEDYDVDMLAELDDNALDLLQQGQSKPTGFSHGIASFNFRLRLLQLASRYRDEMYTLRHLSGSEELQKREAHYLHGARMRMQNLKKTLHKELVYQPEQPNIERFFFSSMIQIHYAWIQLILYRPFFSKTKRTAHPDFPILSISATAATEISHALDKLRLRSMLRGRIHETSLAGFVAGSVLIMNMWEQKNLEGMDEVEQCLRALGSIEDRWQFPGLLHDVLRNFAKVMKKVLTGHCPTRGYTPTQELAALDKGHKDCPDGKTCPNDKTPSSDTTASEATALAPVIPPPNGASNGIMNGATGTTAPSTAMNNAGEYPTFFLGSQDPFSQPFSAGQTNGFFANDQTMLPTGPPASQPMFGEDGWLNELNTGGFGFMDPQFNDWLNSWLLASQETLPANPVPLSNIANDQIFTVDDTIPTGVNGEATWTIPWPFDPLQS